MVHFVAKEKRIQVRHRTFGDKGTAIAVISDDLTWVQWDNPGTLLNFSMQNHNLIFTVPAPTRRI